MRSRRDLQRIHRMMGTRRIVLHALQSLMPLRTAAGPVRVLELGAGDGSLMLRVAHTAADFLPQVDLTLLDRQSLVTPQTLAGYRRLGWTATPRVIDVIDWARDPDASLARWDLVVANLFLHHFDALSLARLLSAVAARTNRFLACEPSRRWLALAGSRLVGLLGANAVTRGDAVLSVHAGFRAEELSAQWITTNPDWRLSEYSAGLFSHCFIAERVGAASGSP